MTTIIPMDSINEMDANCTSINISLNVMESDMLSNSGFHEIIAYSEERDDEEVEELPVSIDSCVALNNAYQDSIEELKQYLIGKRRENESRQQELNTNTNYESVKDITLNNCGYTHPNSLIPFMAPYFKDIKGLSAPQNEDVAEKARNGEINEAFLSPSKPWNVNEREKLKEIVEIYAMETLQKPLRDEKEKLTKNKKFINQQIVDKIDELTKKIDQIAVNQSSKKIQLPERGQSLDWLKFASQLDSEHNHDECQIYWDNYLHPSINKSDWTKEEDQKLEDLVKEYGTHNWDKVSQLLDTGRLAWQCCSRYQSEMNRDIKRVGPLTKAEADTVEKVIESCRVGDYIPWHQVSYFIEGRTLPQIKHYWNKINVPKRGDVWTEDENKVLSAAVKKFGTHNWRKVAQYLPGRSNRQCRERYMMRMNFTHRKLGNWTQAEDSDIFKYAQQYDYHWVKLEEHIKGRNARQIASRYELLMKHKSNQKSGKQSKKLKNTRSLAVRNRLYDRIRQMLNRNKDKAEDLDHILRTGRAKLAKRLELECNGVNVSSKGRPKKTPNEGNIDNKITEMFAIFEHKASPKKALARGAQDQCVYDSTKRIIEEMLTGNKCKSNSDLDQSIRCLISKIITSNNLIQSETNETCDETQAIDEELSLIFPPNRTTVNNETSDETPDETQAIDRELPLIFPPNRTTVKGLRGMLLQTDYLSRKIAKSNINIDEYSSSVLEDEDYKRLSAQFKSLFCWPALLSLIDTPELIPQQKVVNISSGVKPKRRSWLTTDSSRMIEIRSNQTKLIQTAMQSQCEEPVISEQLDEPMHESSTSSPWYLKQKDRRYNLKSLDKNSFVFTRVKPRLALIPESEECEESPKPLNRKRKPTTGESNSPLTETSNSCDETVIVKRSKTSKNTNGLTATPNNAISSDSNDKPIVKPNKRVMRRGVVKTEPDVKSSTNRRSPRFSASRVNND